jgi:hypothetical protein
MSYRTVVCDFTLFLLLLSRIKLHTQVVTKEHSVSISKFITNQLINQLLSCFEFWALNAEHILHSNYNSKSLSSVL